MRRLSALLGLFALGFVLPACGPTAPSSVTGTWNGMWVDPAAGPASLTVTLAQTGMSLSGTWSIQFQGAVLPVTGSLTGNLNGTSLTATFTPTNPAACNRDITATVDKMSMKGMYAYAQCASAGSGTLTLSEQ